MSDWELDEMIHLMKKKAQWAKKKRMPHKAAVFAQNAEYFTQLKATRKNK
jgi:hypothetical protein